ncbi:hypothetical protein [Desertibaculum subflavum]|uniref:hypothetical protein n=1 Tax=Desertibaculum subflavum TaxID=2268458 RepID=UPI0034D2B709
MLIANLAIASLIALFADEILNWLHGAVASIIGMSFVRGAFQNVCAAPPCRAEAGLRRLGDAGHFISGAARLPSARPGR